MKKRDELPDEIYQRILDELKDQQEGVLSRFVETDKLFTNATLVTNGGAAVATLALLEARVIDGWLIVLALVLFTFGVIVAVVGLSILRRVWHTLHQELLSRSRMFMDNELSVEEIHASLTKGKIRNFFQGYAGEFSMACFVVGVVAGACGVAYGGGCGG